MEYLTVFKNFFIQIKAQWLALKSFQKAIIIVTAFFIILLSIVTAFTVTSTSYVMLFTQERLQTMDIGELKSYLDNLQIPYKMSENKGLLIPKDREQQVRMELALYGLPKTQSGKGYELFDANTWIKGEKEMQVLELRALKGQLEHDIGQYENVRSAHVILDIPPARPFGGSGSQTKASVILQLRPGARISAQEIRAITFHVAGAVRGLSPNMVAISDTTGKLYQSIDPDGNFDMIRNSELATEEHLKAKIDGMLAAIVGYDNFYSTVQVTMQRDKVAEERKVFSGTIDGFDLGSPVIMTLSDSGEQQVKSKDMPKISQSSKNDVGSEQSTSQQYYQMAVPLDHIKKTTTPGKIENISIGVLIDERIFTAIGASTPEKPAPLHLDKNALKAEIENQLITIIKGYAVNVYETVSFAKFDRTPLPPLPTEQVVNITETNTMTTLIAIIMLGVMGILLMLYRFQQTAREASERKRQKSTLAELAEKRTLADLEDVLNSIKDRLQQPAPVQPPPGNTTQQDVKPSIREILSLAPISELADFLNTETPQVAALFLCLVESERALEILRQMPFEKQSEILVSMATIEDLDSDAFKELINSTSHVLGGATIESTERLADSSKAAAKILSGYSPDEQKEIMTRLESVSPAGNAKIARLLKPQNKG